MFLINSTLTTRFQIFKCTLKNKFASTILRAILKVNSLCWLATGNLSMSNAILPLSPALLSALFVIFCWHWTRFIHERFHFSIQIPRKFNNCTFVHLYTSPYGCIKIQEIIQTINNKWCLETVVHTIVRMC
jgi:hypothetical protein